MQDSIETRNARLEQRVEDLALIVQSVASLVPQHAQMDVRFGHLEASLQALHDDITRVRWEMDEQKRRDNDDRERRIDREAEDRRARRNAYIAGAFGVFIQLIAIVGGALIVSGGGP